MINRFGIFSLISFLFMGCSYGQLDLICTTPSELEEISAIEYDEFRDVFWVIEDSGNSNEILAIDAYGKIKHRILLKDTKNKDWEDLSRDANGHLYVGDFGNNKKSRNSYKIYKLKASELDKTEAKPTEIEFRLPKKSKEADFEAFFVLDGYCYLFSKADKHTEVYRIPAKKGTYEANKLTSYKFKGDNNKVTSAAISPDAKVVVLLNHSKLWKLSGFKGEDFFSAKVEALEFNHKSQKEGIGFLNHHEVVISDERNGDEGGKFYKFRID
jgi:hypothetical protein